MKIVLLDHTDKEQLGLRDGTWRYEICRYDGDVHIAVPLAVIELRGSSLDCWAKLKRLLPTLIPDLFSKEEASDNSEIEVDWKEVSWQGIGSA